MAAEKLPATADRSGVVLMAFDYNNPQRKIVVPLAGNDGTDVTGMVSGNATLVAGTVAVANTLVKSTSKVIVGRKTIGGTAGNLSYTLNAGVGFTINSSSGTDTSVATYLLIP